MIQALLACVLLQNTWVVDDTPGPGVDFPDIPPAVAAAGDGDILLVQPGTYSHFTLSGKGLRILGAGAPTTVVQLPGTNFTRTTIESVPASSLVYVDRLRFEGSMLGIGTGQARVRISGTTTRVALADVTIQSGDSSSTAPTALRIDAAEVHLARCALQGASGIPLFLGATSGGVALWAENGARVLASSSTMEGGNGGGGGAAGNGGNGGTGVYVTSGSQISISDCTVVGGSGGCNFSAAFAPCGGGAAGIYVSSSLARISGGGTSSVVGGNGACLFPNTLAASGIYATGSATVLVHSVTVLGGLGGGFCGQVPATWGAGITLDLPSLPVLSLSGALILSGTATLALSNGPPVAPFLIAMAASPGVATAGPLFMGEIGIDPVDWVLLFSGSLSASGDFALSIPLSGVAPQFVHFPVYLQGIALDPSGAYWRVSNSTVATLRP